MTRPTDAATARAWQKYCSEHAGEMVIITDAQFIVTRMAEEFDAEAGGNEPHVASVTTSPERVQIPAESEHVAPDGEERQAVPSNWTPSQHDGTDAPYDRCPTCTAHMPVGKTCGGVNCGLRWK